MIRKTAFRLCHYCFENRIYDDDSPMCIECMELQIDERRKRKIFVPHKGKGTVTINRLNKSPVSAYTENPEGINDWLVTIALNAANKKFSQNVSKL